MHRGSSSNSNHPAAHSPQLNRPLTSPTQERNSLGAVKAVTAAQLAMATDAVHSVTLDEAIEAMRLTAAGA
jgi:L-serine deaminase